MTYFRKSAIALLSVSGALMIGATATTVSAHPGRETHSHILTAPIAGKFNKYWDDYKSDVEEAESELRSDLRRADTAQDEREARAEFRRELVDARQDYSKEMREKGYLSRGQVDVLD